MQASVFTCPVYSNIPRPGLLVSNLFFRLKLLFWSQNKNLILLHSLINWLKSLYCLPIVLRKKSKELYLVMQNPCPAATPLWCHSLGVSLLSSLKGFLLFSPATGPLHILYLAFRMLTNLPLSCLYLVHPFRTGSSTFFSGKLDLILLCLSVGWNYHIQYPLPSLDSTQSQFVIVPLFLWLF